MKHWATAGYLPPKAIDFWFLIRGKEVVRSKEKNLKNEDTDTNRRHHDEDRKNPTRYGLDYFCLINAEK